MKSTTLVPVFLLLLSTFIVSHLPSATADAVIDTDGDRLRNGGEYYILPAFTGRGGGVDLAATGNETCALTVVQASSDEDPGRPVIISSPYRIGFINEGSPLYLSFAPVPECAPTPSEWTVVQGLPVPYALKITGYDNTVSGSFAIEKSLFDFYKLTFLPASSDSSSDVGVNVDDNGRRSLALVGSNETPLLVRFQKAGFSSGLLEKA